MYFATHTFFNAFIKSVLVVSHFLLLFDIFKDRVQNTCQFIIFAPIFETCCAYIFSELPLWVSKPRWLQTRKRSITFNWSIKITTYKLVSYKPSAQNNGYNTISSRFPLFLFNTCVYLPHVKLLSFTITTFLKVGTHANLSELLFIKYSMDYSVVGKMVSKQMFVFFIGKSFFNLATSVIIIRNLKNFSNKFVINFSPSPRLVTFQNSGVWIYTPFWLSNC